MARHKRFAEEAVLERAMRAFWAHGYAATSIQDLVSATGVNRASLYGTFGDKRRLFLAAVDHYVARIATERLGALQGDVPARAALGRYFDELIAASSADGRGLGCLLTNTAIELAPHEPEIAAMLRARFDRVEAAFLDVIRRGQAAGEIAAEKDARALARFLVATVQGLRVLTRAGEDDDTLREIVNVALGALD